MRDIKITINKASFPAGVKGFSILDDSSTFRIFINDTLDPDDQAAAFLHECLHIWNGDHTSKDDADHIEKKTHEQLLHVLLICNKQ